MSILDKPSITGSVLEILRKRIKPEKPAPPVKLPVAAVITEDDLKAIEDLPILFGSVVPTERVALSPVELQELANEREVIDKVIKLAGDRKDNIRTTVLNHIDVTKEKEGVDPEVPRDKDGHYLIDTKEPILGTHKCYSWETHESTSNIDPKKLYDLCHSGGYLTHEDYLNITIEPVPVRVFSEEKAMKYLQKRPDILDSLVEAMSTPTITGSFFIRNQK